MTEQYTIYRAKGKDIGLVFLFKYDLNGNLKLFEIVEGVLNDEQMFWLYSTNFPATEALMKANWIAKDKFKKVFEIEAAPADLSFEALWNRYGHKVSKAEAQKSYKKLKEADLIKCFLAIPDYEKYLATKPHIEKLHLSTFINQRRFEDEWPIAQPQPQPAKGANYNNALKDLATKKTEK